MRFNKYYIVADTREQFKNESLISSRPYNDHCSNESINYIVNQLREIGYDVEVFGGVEKLIDACYQKKVFPETLFLNFSDGLNQNNRKAQSAILLELLGVPYTGSDSLAMLMAGNKAYAKKMVSTEVNVPHGILVFKNDSIPQHLNFPVVLKPNREGSSIGIYQKNICSNVQEIEAQLPDLLNQFSEILVEEYIPGYEITCFIIGNRGSYYLTEPIICEYNGVQYFDNFVFGLEEKASRHRKEYLARNVLNNLQVENIRHVAQIAFETLNMKDFARVDFRLQKDGQLYFIEINGNAVISKTSEIGIISHELNIPFGEIVANIVHAATKRLCSNHE